MIVNQAALRGLYTGFKMLFQKAFDGVKPMWDKVATKVPSSHGEENYKWLGKIPMMREWIGDRQIKNLSASDYTIKNKKFEATVAVARTDIEDDSLGMYNPMVQMLGQGAAEHPDVLVFELLKNGFTQACYDGKAFFATDHKVDKKTVSNKSTKALGMESYIEARSAMMSQTDENKKPLGITPTLLVVPPALESVAREILKADQIDGTTNTMKDTAELLVVPQLAGEDKQWYLLSTNRPLKPIIYQERKKAKLVGMTSDTDEHVFKKDEFLYGVDSRGNVGYGFWQMAYGSTGTTA